MTIDLCVRKIRLAAKIRSEKVVFPPFREKAGKPCSVQVPLRRRNKKLRHYGLEMLMFLQVIDQCWAVSILQPDLFVEQIDFRVDGEFVKDDVEQLLRFKVREFPAPFGFGAQFQELLPLLIDGRIPDAVLCGPLELGAYWLVFHVRAGSSIPRFNRHSLTSA